MWEIFVAYIWCLRMSPTAGWQEMDEKTRVPQMGTRAGALDDGWMSNIAHHEPQLGPVALFIVLAGCMAVSAQHRLAGAILLSSGSTVFLVESVHFLHTSRWFHSCGRWLIAAVLACLILSGVHFSRGLAVTSSDEADARAGARFNGNRYEWWRYQAYLLWEEPESSKFAFFVALLGWLISLYACISYTANTCTAFNPQINPSWRRFNSINEASLSLYFTFEYSCRIWSARDRYEFAVDTMSIIDFCTFAPWWFGLLAAEGIVPVKTSWLRVLRVFRIFRLMRMAGSFDTLQVLFRSLEKSIDSFLLLLIFLAVGTYLISALAWEIDSKTWNSDLSCWVYLYPLNAKKPVACMPYQSIPDAFYYAVTTMTTVGYGDIVPGTQNGRIVSCLGMVLGVLVIAMPVGVLSKEFQEVYAEVKTGKDEKKRQALENEGARLVTELKAMMSAAIDHINRAKVLLERSAMNQVEDKLAKMFRTHCDAMQKQICEAVSDIIDVLLDMLPKLDLEKQAVNGGEDVSIEMSDLSITRPPT